MPINLGNVNKLGMIVISIFSEEYTLFIIEIYKIRYKGGFVSKISKLLLKQNRSNNLNTYDTLSILL